MPAAIMSPGPPGLNPKVAFQRDLVEPLPHSPGRWLLLCRLYWSPELIRKLMNSVKMFLHLGPLKSYIFFFKCENKTKVRVF